jgi:mannitol/fructose-specific phosphotransferase system IIA component (Ntr-type)
MAFRLADHLSEKNIALFPSAPSKPQVLGHLISLLDLPDPSAALKAILAREEIGSTIIDDGLAVPHARLHGLKRLQAAIGIIPDGVVDHKSHSGPVHIYVLFFGNADDMTEHLAFLARVSAVMQKKSFRDKLIKAATPAKVLELLQKAS